MRGFALFFVSIAVVAGLIALLVSLDREDPVEHELTLFCAAGLRKPVARIAEEYEKETGTRVAVRYAGSGALLSELQVQSGGDLYLAADKGYIATAREKGLVAESIPLCYQVPIIAVAKGNPKGIERIEDLLRDDVRFALADPQAAAVGKKVRKLLEAAGHWREVEARATVTKPTVNDVANDVKLRAVDAGIIWDATAGLYPDLEAIHVVDLSAGRSQVTVGVLESTVSSAAALRFARYLGARDRGLEVFREFGFETVEGDVWSERPELIVWSGGVNRLAVEQTIEEFEAREGVDVLVTYNGCGILSGNMVPLAGKPGFPDVYFSCDRSYLDKVSQWYFTGKMVSQTDMVIVVPKGNPKGIHSLRDLSRDGLRLGFADPEKSALGALTARLLRDEGIHDAVWRNVITTDGTADLLLTKMQIAKGSSLDAVIVYLANCPNVRDELDIVTIDSPLALARQPIATSRQSDHRRLTERFIDRVLSETSRKRFREVGFDWLSGQQVEVE